jgi:hypothetical protein
MNGRTVATSIDPQIHELPTAKGLDGFLNKQNSWKKNRAGGLGSGLA